MENIQDIRTQNRADRRDLFIKMKNACHKQLSLLEADDADGFAQEVDHWQEYADQADALDAQFHQLMQSMPPMEKDAILAVQDADAQALEHARELQQLHAQVASLAREKMKQYKADFTAGQRNAERAMSYINPYSALEDSVYFDKKR